MAIENLDRALQAFGGIAQFMQNRQAGKQLEQFAGSPLVDPFGPQRAQYQPMLQAHMAGQFDPRDMPGFSQALDFALQKTGREQAGRGKFLSGNMMEALTQTSLQHAYQAYLDRQKQLAELSGANIPPQAGAAGQALHTAADTRSQGMLDLMGGISNAAKLADKTGLLNFLSPAGDSAAAGGGITGADVGGSMAPGSFGSEGFGVGTPAGGTETLGGPTFASEGAPLAGTGTTAATGTDALAPGFFASEGAGVSAPVATGGAGVGVTGAQAGGALAPGFFAAEGVGAGAGAGAGTLGISGQTAGGSLAPGFFASEAAGTGAGAGAGAGGAGGGAAGGGIGAGIGAGAAVAIPVMMAIQAWGMHKRSKARKKARGQFSQALSQLPTTQAGGFTGKQFSGAGGQNYVSSQQSPFLTSSGGGVVDPTSGQLGIWDPMRGNFIPYETLNPITAASMISEPALARTAQQFGVDPSAFNIDREGIMSRAAEARRQMISERGN